MTASCLHCASVTHPGPETRRIIHDTGNARHTESQSGIPREV